MLSKAPDHWFGAFGVSTPGGAVVVIDGDLAHITWNTNQAAEAAHVPPGRIRIWAHRGKLQAVNPKAAHPRYRALDVLQLEAASRQRARRSEAA
jgi:hypothetical protein